MSRLTLVLLVGLWAVLGCRAPSWSNPAVPPTTQATAEERASTVAPAEDHTKALGPSAEARDRPALAPSLIASPVAVPPVASTVLARQETAPASFSGERARQVVEYLADEIGPRVAGSPAEERAAQYLAAQFAAVGLTTDRPSFTFRSYVDRGSAVDLLLPEARSIRSVTLTSSRGGEVSGEVVDVGLAREGDFDAAKVPGKIALAKRGENRFSDKEANVAAAGASALIVVNNAPGTFQGSLVEPSSIPVVSVSQEDGEQLVTLVAAGGVRARVKVDADEQQRTSQNVVGSLSGGNSVVVIGAHYDSVAAGPGANDNASGTATLIELARVVGARQYPFTVRFVAFGAEEVGLVGSRRYVNQLSQVERDAVLGMVNLDMVGVGDRVAFGGDPNMVQRAVKRAADAGLAAGRMGERGGSSSDHASFMAANIPSLFLYRGEDPNYHTAGDRVEHVRAEHLQTAGELVLGLLDEFAAESQ